MEVENKAPSAPRAVASRSDQADDNGSAQSVRLRTIVIHNFKNYIGEHVIDVDGEAFVCFFGRNGAGKSCVVDAIAFCLGATPQQLRVKRLANLVNDIAVSTNPEAFASVVLYFDVIDAAGEKKCFSVKRIVEAATSQSRYFCRDSRSLDWMITCKGALETILRRFGIDMQLQDRFIIRQANATGLAQMTSLQLLHFCERIIGTSDLKDELVLMNRKWNERSSAINHLRQQIHAKEGEAMQCQPMVLKFQDWVEKTEKIRVAQQEAKSSLLTIDRLILKHESSALKHLANELKLRRREEQHLHSAEKRREKTKTCLLGSIDDHQKIVSEAVQLLRQATREKAKRSNALQTVKAELRAIETRIVHFTREKAAAAAAVDELHAQTAADSSLLIEKQNRLQSVEKAIAAHAVQTDEQESHDNEIQDLVHEIDRMEAVRLEEMSKQDEIRRMKTEAEKRVAGIQKETEKCLRIKLRQEGEITQQEQALDEDIEAVTELKDTQTVLRSQVELLEADIRRQIQRKSKCASRSRGQEMIQQIQESLGSHIVLGRLGELATAESAYATAVNSALQTQLQYVVVQDRKAAVSISRIFSEKSIGRVSCCVLEDVKNEFRCDPSVCGFSRDDHDYGNDPVPLCQVVTCVSETIRQVFHMFGHNWLICEDADQAANHSRNGSKNYVTLQGDLFFSDGSIRTYRHETKSITSTSARIYVLDAPSVPRQIMDDGNDDQSVPRLSDQLKKCRARQHQNQQSMEELNKRIQSSRLRIEVAKDELKDTSATINANAAKLEQAQQNLRHQDALPSESLSTESQEWKTKLAELKKLKARLTKRTGDKERAVLLTCRVEILREMETLKAREALTKINITKLQGKGQAIAHQLATLGEKVDQLKCEEETVQDGLRAAENEMDAAVQKVDTKKESLTRSQFKLEELDTEIRSLTSQLDIIRADVDRLVNNKNSLLVKIASLKKEISDTDILTTEKDEPMEDFSLDRLEDRRGQIHQNMKSHDEAHRVMELVKSSISVETVERAIACEQEITSLQAELDSSHVELTTLSTRQHETAVARHGRLVDALRIVNDNFSRIYRLMNEDGDCYLGYSLERTTLFSEGITLNCKPDESHWQSFVGLSGGQQVVCAVSLMLALQASFPNPFYVCDEIDAALDTVNVQKLAELLRDQSSQSKSQFLVVSHRPEMWDISKCLVGVYERESSAHIVSCRFE